MEQTLPQNLEAEAALLGSVLISNDCLEKIEGVDPSDFYKESHQRIFECMKELHEKESPIDIITLSTKLKERRMLSRIGGEGYLASLANSVPTSGSAKHYAKLVTETSLRRKLIDKAEQITQSAYDEKLEVSELLDFADNEITAVIEGNSERLGDEKFVDLSVLAHKWDEFYESGEEDSQSFGISPLDAEFIAIPNKEVAFIAAPPGGKKSMFAINSAYNLSRLGKRVCYVNLEMNDNSIIKRLICISGQLDSRLLRNRTLPEEARMFALAKLTEKNFKIISPASATIKQIERMVRLEKKQRGIDILFVDHMHIVRSKYADEIQRTAEVAEGLKTMARKFDIPIVALAQMSKSARSYGSTPNKSDTRGSSAIEDTAGMLLQIKECPMPTIPLSPDEKQLDFWIVKNRDDRDGYSIPLKYNWRTLKIS